MFQFDYAGLYPNCCIDMNISPETLSHDPIENGKAIDINYQSMYVGSKEQSDEQIVYFDQSRAGIIPSFMQELLDKRKHYKKLMEQEA